MSEGTVNEPSKDTIPVIDNRTIATKALYILGYGSLATGGIDEYNSLRQKIPIDFSIEAFYRSKASRMFRIPDKEEARRLLRTAWTGWTGSLGETNRTTENILDFRVVEPGSVITRSRLGEQRENNPVKTSYKPNTLTTELLVRRIIRGLGFVDEGQNLDRSMRGLRRDGVLTIAKNGISVTVTMPQVYKPEVSKLLDAAYRIQVQRTSPTPIIS